MTNFHLYLIPNLLLYLLKNQPTAWRVKVVRGWDGKRIGPLVNCGGLITEQLHAYTATRLLSLRLCCRGGATGCGQKI